MWVARGYADAGFDVVGIYIDWMDTAGLPQAIPPAYTRIVGTHLQDLLTRVRM